MPEPLTPVERYQKTRTILLTVVTVILAGWALKGTYVVTMPLVLAFLVAVLLHPVQGWLNRNLPRYLRFLSIILTMLILVVVVLGLVYALWVSFGLILEKAPAYLESGRDLWDQVRAWANRHQIPVQTALPPLQELTQRVLGWVTMGLTSLWLFIFMLVLLFFLVLLMLLETSEWWAKVERAFGSERAHTILATLDSVEGKIRKFLLIKTLVSALSGFAGGLWLWFLGVDLAPVWGFLIFLLNYIPNIGSIVGILPPSIVALLQFGPGGATLAIVGLTTIEQVLGNFVAPRLEGRTLAISPLIVLVSIVFWGWVWGIIGALIGVLITATLIIIFDHVPALRPLARLVSRPPFGDTHGAVSQNTASNDTESTP